MGEEGNGSNIVAGNGDQKASGGGQKEAAKGSRFQRKLREALLDKLKESFSSAMPVAALVLLIYVTPFATLSFKELLVFLISTVFLIGGIATFNLGADMAMTPMGEHIGTGLTKSRQLLILLSVSFLMGLFITVAEPDLSVLASQVSGVIDSTMLIMTIGFGVGFFLLLGVIKIVFKKDQASLLLFFYMMIFALVAVMFEKEKSVFLPLSFDSGGVTTGPITVPFLMALGVGISSSIGGKNAQENSFGLVALCSIGPVLSMIALSMLANGTFTYEVPEYSIDAHLGIHLLEAILDTFKEVSIALGLVVFFFLVLQVTVLKLSRQSLLQIFFGLIYTLVGLVVFLTAVTVGYMPVGYTIGRALSENSRTVAVAFCFVLGMATVLAEPAIHVLNHQVEEVTDGNVSRRQMMTALSIGVGLSVGLSALRAVMGFSVLYYLVPGYLLSLGLSFFVPKLYTAIAFDSGGVASGPLTSSFVLPLIVGICVAARGEDAVLEAAFGMVAMVAMTPLIAIQMLGFRAIVARRAREKRAMRRIFSAADEQIIYFDWEDLD